MLYNKSMTRKKLEDKKYHNHKTITDKSKHDESKHCHDLRFEEYVCNYETGIIGLKCEKCKYYY